MEAVAESETLDLGAGTGTKAAEVRARMKEKRGGIECLTPSGETVTVRPINLERHALAGGLPARLKAIAQGGVTAVDDAIKAATEGDYETLEYLDSLVCQVLVSPRLVPPRYARKDDPGVERGELKEGDLVRGDNPDDYLLPADYRWLLLLAYGEEERDGTGRLLWGVEPLSRWATFRAKHGCTPDCPACHAAQGELQVSPYRG